MTVPLVRCSAYTPFLDFLTQADIRLGHEFDKSFIAAIVERDAETLVPVHLAHSILEKGARKLGLADFGYVVGQHARIDDLGLFGRSLRHSMTLYDALGKLLTHFPLYSSAEQITWVPAGLEVYFFHHYRQKTSSGSRYAQQCALLLMRDAVRLVAGPQWQPDKVFSPNPSNDKQIMESAFRGAAVCQASRYGLAFPSAFLHLAVPTRILGRSGNESDYTTLTASAPASDLVGSTRQVIAAMMIYGRCQFEEIAEAIGMSPRTLQRRLAECGVRFSEVLSQARFDLAMKLMSDPTIRMIDVAFELGYAEQSSFTRAFRCWTGVAPSEFQRIHSDLPIR
ncbi:MAG: helix-turn-helix domain-containing protein [Candidatus Competibacteraceae bacterium]|jgi:AraC-like DNA-binding protein|nr:helix-turn-helix domain-containing protein [Candidatus Competibacteraceae bacterium]